MEDTLTRTVDRVIARLSDPGALPAGCDLRDTPADPAEESSSLWVEVYAEGEDEPLEDSMDPPRADQATGTVLVICKARAVGGWRPALLGLRDKVRWALLTDPTFMKDCGGVKSLRSEFALSEVGKTVVMTCALRFEFEYVTEYPPARDDTLDEVKIDADLAPADGRIEADARITGLQDD